MDVVRLFEGAEALDIAVNIDYDGAHFRGTVTCGERRLCLEREAVAHTPVEEKSLHKRYAKLMLYRILSREFQKRLPWGALTGIRPTRLAYTETERGADFRQLFREMEVSEENIALVGNVMRGQQGIYERNGDNCDLFVSLPFCPTKCAYCSFVTAPIKATEQYLDAYLTALEEELAALPPIRRLRSVYIGGGTPFVLEPDRLERVLRAVAPLRTNGCEYTVEAGRPDVFTREKLELCKAYGVTRVCINAQSFSDRTLQAIGRNHTAAQVEEAFALAAPFGFSVNCDLIAGLTGESYEEFCASIERAVALAPQNITVHTLCLKRGSRLKEETEVLGEGDLAHMIAYSRRRLAAAGYSPYYLYRQKYMAGAHENVGWTKPGCASVYNIDVMEEIADNIAVGANAVSKRVPVGGRIERLGSPKDIPSYLKRVKRTIEERNALFTK